MAIDQKGRPARERGARIETLLMGLILIPTVVAPRVSAGRGLKLNELTIFGQEFRVAPRVSAGRGLKHAGAQAVVEIFGESPRA